MTSSTDVETTRDGSLNLGRGKGGWRVNDETPQTRADLSETLRHNSEASPTTYDTISAAEISVWP